MKKKKLNQIPIFISCLMLICGCGKVQIAPNGKQIEEIRNTGPFNSVSISGSSKVYINYGTMFKVVISGSDNLITNFSSRVDNNELILKYDNVNVKTDDLSIYITTPDLARIKISGTSVIGFSGSFPDRESFKASLTGAGTISYNGALKVNMLEVETEGSGNADLEGILTKNANIKILGSSNLKATVSDHLKAKITGSGNIYYSGSPILETDFTGSGRAIKN